MTPADVIAEARSWIGTPFHWQASAKRVGCDCKGLVAGVARELGLPEARSLYAGISDYSEKVPVALLKAGLAATLQQVGEPKPGDVLLMQIARKPQHLGIYTGTGVIHCWGRGAKGVGQKVIEHPAKSALRAWPLDSVWRFRSLEGG
jgi:cell wall-associated NlpC family hydrolase